MEEITEFRASRVDLRETEAGAMLLARTDKGPVTIYLSDLAFQNLIHQTKLVQLGDSEQPDRLWDKD